LNNEKTIVDLEQTDEYKWKKNYLFFYRSRTNASDGPVVWNVRPMWTRFGAAISRALKSFLRGFFSQLFRTPRDEIDKKLLLLRISLSNWLIDHCAGERPNWPAMFRNNSARRRPAKWWRSIFKLYFYFRSSTFYWRKTREPDKDDETLTIIVYLCQKIGLFSVRVAPTCKVVKSDKTGIPERKKSPRKNINQYKYTYPYIHSNIL